MGKRSRGTRAPAHTGPLVHWWGDQLAPHSLAYVNRELCRRLAERPSMRLVLLDAERGGVAPDVAADPGLDALRRRIRPNPGRHPDVTVRHRWPADLSEPAGTGPLVICQPWEFGALPAEWVGPMTDVVDEVWCNSTYVRDVYERSGVPAEKLHLLPHGVDGDRFRPDGPVLDLPTSKSVKLLFVGGTIHRKGIDVLLDAYTKAFRASDDVALVVKGSQSGGAYLGSSIAAELERLRAIDPAAPEIVYIDDELAHDDLAALYRSCDALVHPYRGEGFGLPVAEAMASGLPVVVTAGGATDDFCADDRAFLIPSTTAPVADLGNLPAPSAPGYAVQEPDGDALVELLRTVANGGADVERRAGAGRAWVTEHLDWEQSAAIVEERILDLVGTTPRRTTAPRRHEPATPGVNVVGFFGGDFGLGEAARLLVESLDRAGIPVATQTVEMNYRRATVPFTERGDGSLPYARTIWAIQPELLRKAIDAARPRKPSGHRDIGYWFWESELPNQHMADVAPLLDEVWVGSQFVAGAVRQAFTGPVHVVPPPIPEPPAAALDRHALGLPEDRFLFLFEFDHASIAARKNPEAALRAFEQAFPDPSDDGPVLVLKAINGEAVPEAHRPFVVRAAARPDIRLLEERLSAEANHALIAACDAYVSLHRAEGFGLTLAEAMARGKPVIATGWSGNVDFMDDASSILVPYELFVAPPTPPYPDGTRWAEADVDAAAEAMRRLVAEPTFAAGLGAAAAHHVRQHHGLDARAALLRRLVSRRDEQPLLSACMIVKDEEQSLPRCLASLDGVVDEIVVYDTGSTDRTVEIAEAAGARVIRGWWDDDFSRARNAALAECRGTWILHVDADETLACDPAATRATLARPGMPDVVVLTIDNVGDDGSVGSRHKAARLFRRQRAHWLGRLHEQIVARPGQDALVRGSTDDVRILHYGYTSDVMAAKGKAERNIRLAAADLDAAPHDERPLLVLNLARSLAADGRLEEALERCAEGRAGASQARPAVMVSLLHFGIELLFTLGRPAEAVEWIDELRSLSVAPRLADFLAGTAKLFLGQAADELADLAEVEELWDDSGLAVSGDLLRHRTALALAATGRWEQAYPALVDAAERTPHLPIWAPLARASHAVGADPAAFAGLVPEEQLRPVLAQLLLVAPDAADPLGEALWARWPDDARLVGFAVHHAVRAPTSRSMEWAARVRAAGLPARCPLVARAGRDDVEPLERLRAAAIAHTAFADERATSLLDRLAHEVGDADLVGAMIELDALAPDRLGPFVATLAAVPARRAGLAAALDIVGAEEQADVVRELLSSGA